MKTVKVIEGVGFAATGPEESYLVFFASDGKTEHLTAKELVPVDGRAEWSHIDALVDGFGRARSEEMRATEFAERTRPYAYRMRITVEAIRLTEAETETLVAAARARNDAQESEDALSELRALVAHAEETFENEALDWESRYDAIFANAPRIRALMSELSLGPLDYYDPDTTYEEDAGAYVSALRSQLKPALELGR